MHCVHPAASHSSDAFPPLISGNDRNCHRDAVRDACPWQEFAGTTTEEDRGKGRAEKSEAHYSGGAFVITLLCILRENLNWETVKTKL